MNFEKIIDHDKLNREVFTFYLNDRLELHLHNYYKQQRESPRQNWKIIARYDRLNQRDNKILITDIVIPAGIIRDITELIAKSIVLKIK